MRTTETKLYQFNELSPEAQDKAIARLWDLNVDHEWWDSTYEDAARVGIKITHFDLGRRHEIGILLTDSLETVCMSILAEHGKKCDTYQTAKDFLSAWDALPVDDDGEQDRYALEDLESEFCRAIGEDYLSILSKEHGYLTSREVIVETIEANEYEFTEDGRLA